MFGIIGTIVVVAVIGTIAAKYHLSMKEHSAIQIAQKYLAQKYEQEMQFQNVRYSWIDPSLYHVTFLSASTNVKFEVSVWPKALNFPQNMTDYGDEVTDSYLKDYFCQKTEEVILPEMRAIWDENMSINVSLSTSNLYSQRVTEKPNEQMMAIEMEPFYNYDYYIHANRILNNDSKIEEAERILDMIRYIQANQYYPREVLFWYQTGATEKGKKIENRIWFGDGTDPYHIGRFENWSKISSVEEIIQAIDEQWFSKYNN